MSERMRLTAAVMFVRNLQPSADFYRQLLELDVALETDEALLLSASDGQHLVLRALEPAPRLSGALGVQYLVWAATDSDELDRCEHLLQTWNAHVSTSIEEGVKVVEGRDPDRTPILLTYPSRPGIALTRLPTRVYTY